MSYNNTIGVPIDIALTEDIFLGPEISIPAGAKVTLTSDSDVTSFRLIGLDGQGVIRVMSGGRLTLNPCIINGISKFNRSPNTYNTIINSIIIVYY
jgi:hypothetical protein